MKRNYNIPFFRYLMYNLIGDIMDKLIMIKYGELTTKKANRKVFINMLENNVNKILKNEGYKITKDRVRMYIECSSDSLDNIVKKLKNKTC